MASKEPNFWVKTIVGIVVTVVTGLLVAWISGLIGTDHGSAASSSRNGSARHPVVRITEFSTADARVGQYPHATFKVYNDGNDTADRCLIEWDPFSDRRLGKSLAVHGTVADVYGVISKEFAIEAGATYTVPVTGRMPYGGVKGMLTSGAVLSCNNALSKVQVDFVRVAGSSAASG